MKMSVNELYQYVFGNAGKIDVSKMPEAKREEALKIRKIELQKKFKFITENPSLSTQFRALLHKVNNQNLEEYLYGDCTTTLSNSWDLPDDSQIKEEFQKLDEHYCYFLNDESAADHFIQLFKACKLISYFVEENNHQDNDFAFQQAYNILVLVGRAFI